MNQLLWLRPGSVQVHLEARGNAIAAGAGGGFQTEAECCGGADPSLMLDQAAFDALVGANTYNLLSHWGLNASPNPVPEPEGLFAVGGGMVAIAGLLRARRRFWFR